MNYCSRLHNAQLWKDSQWLVLRQESKYHRSSRNLKNSHQDGSERGLQFFNIRTGMKQNGPVGTQVSLIKNIRVKVFVAYTWEKRYKWTLTIWWRQVRTHLYEEQQNGENENIFNVLKWRKALKRLRLSKQQNIHISTTYSLQKDSFLWKQWSHHRSAGWIMPRPTDRNRCEKLWAIHLNI